MTQNVQIPGYRILKILGEGGMATVYLAMQQSLDREVALKVMAPMLAANESFCERFISEGRITAQLTHPNLVTVHDIGSYQGTYYLASEYLPAGSLRERMTRGLSISEALDVARDIAMGLHFAHEKGFVHRDVKPGNILFRANGMAVLADFGIAKAINSTTGATIAGSAIGTPDYMSPEQAQATVVDGRADLYGLGAVLYEMLTGTKPYRANDPYTVALMHVTEPVPTLPAALAWLQPLINGMMAKKPEQRYANGEAFVNACDKLLTERPEGRALRDAHSTRKRVVPRLRAPAVGTTMTSIKPAPSRAGVARWRPGLIALVLGGSFLVVSILVVALRWNRPLSEAPNVLDPSVADRSTLGSDPNANVEANPLDSMDTPTLLAKAEDYLQFGTTSKEYPGRKLAFPEGDSAVDLYRKIIERDPFNEKARHGLKTIAEFFTQSAQKARSMGFDIQAIDLTEKGLRADPDNADLKKLKAELDKAASAKR